VRLITINYGARRVVDCSPDEVSRDEVLWNLILKPVKLTYGITGNIAQWVSVI